MRPAGWRNFLAAVGAGWVLLLAAGVYYARLKHIPFALAALALALSFWYIIREPSPSSDLALLALVAAAMALRFFKQIYTSPVPSIDILGKLMLIRLYASVMLILRVVDGTGFGFLPTAQEWKIGVRYFVYFIPVGVALMFGLGLIRFKTSPTLLAA